MVPLTEHQLDAYASAVYEVGVGDRWVDASVFVDANGPPAVLISACNPWSQMLTDAENATRQQGLYRQIEASRCRWHAARGRAPDFSWIEPGFLVWAAEDLIDAWARAWQQHAVLVLGRASQDPTLRLYSPFAGASQPQRMANMQLEWVGCVPPALP